MSEKKYLFENGVMKLNPKYQKPDAGKTTVAEPNKALAIVSTPDDVQNASELQMEKTGQPMQLSEATTASMEILQDEEFLEKFKAAQPLDGGDLLDGLTSYFAKYEVPIGMVNKLLVLSEYKLNFLIDDSGSMSLDSDTLTSESHPAMQAKFKAMGKSGKMTRWEEAEDRLHVMIDMLAYIPTNEITISFLNRNAKLSLSHQGVTPAEFTAKAHADINGVFKSKPSGGTPIFGRLVEAFGSTKSSTMHYLFTDGVPSDAPVDKVKNLVKNRMNPKLSPLTFISCTENDDEANWMKEIEEDAPFVSELDDFKSERAEVLHDQGATFPFSKGFWLLCLLAAAINEDDLDALDESVPFTKMTMNNLMGRKLSADEYKLYFDNNPNAKKYSHLYNEFTREDVVARQILKNNPTSSSNALLGMFKKQDRSGSVAAAEAPPPYQP